jgi:methionine--tRNA ligase, beta subunit
MSKSKGNVLYADTLVDFFGVDAVRYFVLHEMPFDNDGVISWDLMVERFNSDLANVLGNLVSRTISMTNKYFDGVLTDAKDESVAGSTEIDTDLKDVVLMSVEKVEKKMSELRVADAITEIWTLFKRCNKYIDETTPWILAKEEDKKARLQTVLYNLAESISIGASLLYSFMPETSEKILDMFGTNKRSLEDMNKFGLLMSGTKVVEEPEILFKRLDLEEVLKQVEALNLGGKTEKQEPEIEGVDVEAKDTIEYDDFAKLQIQVGQVIKCEEVPKSKKLLCSQVQIGSTTRQILSGIKQWYSAKDMVGKQVLVVTNLAPRNIAGLESQGMILMAEDDAGNAVLVSPEKNIKTGSEIA